MHQQSKQDSRVLVALDIAKHKHDVLIEMPDGRRQQLAVRNCREEFDDLALRLKSLNLPCVIAFEQTADYHRAIAYYLQVTGFEVRLLSSLAVARTREALHNTWDKNDPKDAQVILHMLQIGAVQIFQDPMVAGTNDIQELSKTHDAVSRSKTELWHRILTQPS